MAKIPSKQVEKPIEKKREKDDDSEDDFDVNSSEYESLSDNAETDIKKMVARRKIEIYWEKKRLKDQFDDLDDSEFNF